MISQGSDGRLMSAYAQGADAACHAYQQLSHGVIDRLSVEQLRAAIERRFGIRYSRGHVWKIATDLDLSHLMREACR